MVSWIRTLFLFNIMGRSSLDIPTFILLEGLPTPTQNKRLLLFLFWTNIWKQVLNHASSSARLFCGTARLWAIFLTILSTCYIRQYPVHRLMPHFTQLTSTLLAFYQFSEFGTCLSVRFLVPPRSRFQAS